MTAQLVQGLLRWLIWLVIPKVTELVCAIGKGCFAYCCFFKPSRMSDRILFSQRFCFKRKLKPWTMGLLFCSFIIVRFDSLDQLNIQQNLGPFQSTPEKI